MRFKVQLAAAVALGLSTSGAFAWGDMYMGDTTNNPNSNMLVHSYGGENLCPAGLQPVLAGGMVCCSKPNAGPYVNRAGGKKVYKKRVSRPRAYAIEGEKGVVYR
ncbi:MAG: hypothetical protein N4A61_05940 [Pelagimonas sp.]|nr:hypothetical protein [Pelagimonas sp.]